MAWPSARLTPRNFGFESRRFFELPPDFLVDIRLRYNKWDLTGVSIQEMSGKIKHILTDDSFFYGVLVILVAITAYGLGKHSNTAVTQVAAESQVVLVREAVVVEKKGPETASKAVVESSEKQLVASKNGTKYHRLTCPGAAQIKEENKVYFDSIQAAQAAGYTAAANCKGLE